MNRPTSDRRTARLIDHAAPPTPQKWLDNDARYFEDIEAEIQRRAEGGCPEEAPWASPRYFDTARHDESATRRTLPALCHLLPLCHLPRAAGAHLRFVYELLRRKCGRLRGAPGAEPAEDTAAVHESPAADGAPPAPARRREATAGPPVRGGRPIVAPLESAEALAG